MKKALSTVVLIATTILSFVSITRMVFLYPLVLMDGIGIVNSFSIMKEVNSIMLPLYACIIIIASVLLKVWNNEKSTKKPFLDSVKDFLLANRLKTYSLLIAIILFALAIGYGLISNANVSFIQLFNGILSNFSYFTYMNAVLYVQLELFSFAKFVYLKMKVN